MIALITAIVVLLTSILGFVIKMIYDKKAADEAHAKKIAEDEKKSADQESDWAKKTNEQNQSIDKQKKAADAWLKNDTP